MKEERIPRKFSTYRSFVCPVCFHQLQDCTCEDYPPWKLQWIDEQIQPAIRILNDKGYKTTGCCEGHWEHIGPDKHGNMCLWTNTSLCFNDDCPISEAVEKYGAPEGFKFEHVKFKQNYVFRHDYKRTLTRDEFEAEKASVLKNLTAWCEMIPGNSHPFESREKRMSSRRADSEGRASRACADPAVFNGLLLRNSKYMPKKLEAYKNYVCPGCWNQLPDCKCPGETFPAWYLLWIDEGIQPAVRALNERGFKTITSCEGHYGDMPDACTYVLMESMNYEEIEENLATLPESVKYGIGRHKIFYHEYAPDITEEQFEAEKAEVLTDFTRWCESLPEWHCIIETHSMAARARRWQEYKKSLED